MSISTDVISSMYQYMTPKELYQRKNLNQLWYREYLRNLPQWVTTIEPWFIAAETGDMQLLDDLLSVAEPPLTSYDEELDIEKEQIINGIEYEEDVYGIIELALDNGNHDIALKLARKYEDKIFDPNVYFDDIIQRIAMFDDDFLKRYLVSGDIVNGLQNYYDRTKRLIIRAYNKGFIDDDWIANLATELVSKKDPRSILLARDFVYIWKFHPILESYSKVVRRRYRELEKQALNIS